VRQQRIEQRIGAPAVVGAGGFEERDGLGDGAALAGEDAFDQGLVGRGDTSLVRRGSTTPFGLSLSKPPWRTGQRPFDRLRANGGCSFGDGECKSGWDWAIPDPNMR
jgi:hypothetical protein